LKPQLEFVHPEAENSNLHGVAPISIACFCEQFMSLHFPDAQLGQVGFFFAASEWRNLQFAFRQPLVTKNLQSSHGRSILQYQGLELVLSS